MELDYKRSSAVDIREAIASRQISCEDYVSTVLACIKRMDGKIHAYLTVNEQEALTRAREIDRKVLQRRRLGRLAGVAVAVKDNICVAGTRTTCASKMLENFVSPYDATVVERLKAEDAIIVGKTNMDEFAMGNSTANSYFGPTANPWKTGWTPGGSSGGSAASVSAGLATLALGSDTGGSVRCPASFCSVVGLKPTYGLVSRYGLIAYANSLEQIGPIAKSVRDCAALLSVIAGADRMDGTSTASPTLDFEAALADQIGKLSIAVPKQWLGEGTQEPVKKVFWGAIDKLEAQGASWSEVSIESLDFALATYYVIAMAEASSNLARYDGVRYGLSPERVSGDWNESYSKLRSEGFGAEVKRRIMLGSFALSAGYFEAYYLKAQKVRTLIKNEFVALFKKFDLVAGPTMPVLPFRLGHTLSPLEEYRIDVNTVPANLAGLPAASVPAGFSQNLPVGLQFVAAPLREDVLLRAGLALESALNLPTTPPEREP